MCCGCSSCVVYVTHFILLVFVWVIDTAFPFCRIRPLQLKLSRRDSSKLYADVSSFIHYSLLGISIINVSMIDTKFAFACSMTCILMQVQWQVAVDPETGSQDELFVRGNQVVWYCGLTPELKIARVSYSVETAVHALWCQFEELESSGDSE